ncbi:deoxycytidine triphosphate deaminase [Azotobacter chroococcum]|uniref:Deoxycytidine triphosphate deaminase n=1 Tax=Azotobacter chroococcum TaxID=353 RepID=A0AA43ZBK5_9GAMM|nr:deoxycytidine triphosphate deaminase [Azotobacter chroococcum]NHN79232.1 deoxycytidine triphosphate deaminase [Azotobacter chroococcum]
MFLSGDTLKKNLESFIQSSNQSSVYVDCAAITLTVGNEIYITPSDDKAPHLKIILEEKKPQFEIPCGQFALITTEEIIKVPPEYLAFISFKATYKFKGLINVSGFHVDPGWNGQLTFSVFNAGPRNIVMEKGDAFALIWYAKLDLESTVDYRKNLKEPIKGLSSEKVTNMTGEVYSPFKLRSELEELKKDFLTLESKIINRYAAILFSIFSAFILYIFRKEINKLFEFS